MKSISNSYGLLIRMNRINAKLRGRTARQLPRLPTHMGCQDITGIIGNMPLLNSGFLKMFASSVLNHKSLKNIS
jgi:hypothetical protein